LVAGIQGYVTPPLPNNLRAEPTPASALLGEIPAGATFDVISGPVCDTTVDGFVWWEVSYNGQRGWTAEDMEKNIAAVQHSVELGTGACELAERAVKLASMLLESDLPCDQTARGGRKAHKLEVKK